MQEILKMSSKTGDQFTAISDLQDNVEHVLFQDGNRQLSQKFPEKVPRYTRIGNKRFL